MAEKITEKRESFSCSLISQARHLYVPRLNTLSNCSSIGLRAWLYTYKIAPVWVLRN